MEPWTVNTLQSADAALLILDLGEADCVEQAAAIRRRLGEKHVRLIERGEALGPSGDGADSLDALFPIRLPIVLLANKSDRLADPDAELEVFRQLTGLRCPAAPVSAQTGFGLGGIGGLLFEILGIVRVYSKVPGHPPNLDRPFTLRGDGTVRDVARLVHRGLAADLKFARLWGSAKFDGEQVSADHPVRDKDIVELHG
jgi:ribosome-interacting GTPase 1